MLAKALSEEKMARVLRQLGLSKRESDIYMLLSKSGSQTAGAVSARLKIERVQTYRTLKNLQEKGFAEATLEAPTRFSVMSFESLLRTFLDSRRSEVESLESLKDELVEYWRSLNKGVSEYQTPRFRVVVQQKKIFEQTAKLIQEAEEQVLLLVTSLGVIQQDLAGILDSIVTIARRNSGIHLRVLADISAQNYSVVSRIARIRSAGNSLQLRHIDLASRSYPQFVIKDGEETLLYLTREERTSQLGQADTGLLIHSRMFASALTESFNEMWQDATPVETRIEQLRTGKPVEETRVIKDPKIAEEKLESVLEKAQKEITAIIPSTAVSRVLDDNLLMDHAQKIRFRIMAPIDMDNMEAARKLSETSEVRSVPISYLTMVTVDDKHVFMFKTPPLEGEDKSLFYFDNAFYTSDFRYVERVNEMLNDIWKRGISITGAISKTEEDENVYISDDYNAARIVDKMLKDHISSVIVLKNNTPIGVISERDILEKVVKARKDPSKVYAKEIVSMSAIMIETGDSLVKGLTAMRNSSMDKLTIMRNGRVAGMLTMKKRK